MLDVVQLGRRRVVGCRSSGSQGADDEGPVGAVLWLMVPVPVPVPVQAK
jgi:hypothetical protein